MADTPTAEPLPVENVEPDNSLSAEERAYMENRGEIPDPSPAVVPAAAEPAATVPLPATQPAEPPPAATPDPVAAAPEPPPPAPEPVNPLLAELARVAQDLRPLADAAKAATAPPPPVVPDFQTDPAGYLKHQADTLAAKTAEIERSQQLQSAHGQLLTAYQRDAAAFAAKTDDFSAAYQFTVAQRIAELQALGFTPDQAAQNVAADELAIVQKAFQDRVSPASRIYAMAKARGYAKKPVSTPNPAAAATVATLNAAPAAANPLAGPGGAARVDLTVEAIADMSDEDFAKLSPAAFKRAMGG